MTRSDQTNVDALGFGEGGFGEGVWEGVWEGGDQLVVTLDDATKRSLSAVLKNGIGMWERLLRRGIYETDGARKRQAAALAAA